MEYAPPYAKVTAFITRHVGQGRELLVFRHPSAGVQLPAGSIEPGEPPVEAAIREVKEETGLEDVAVVSNLGIRSYALPDNGRLVAHETKLYSGPGLALAGDGVVLRRGLTVHEVERTPDFSQVELREYVVREGVLLVDKTLLTGWAPVQHLSSIMERHFFHIEAPATTPNNWTWFAEGEHNFECYWVPLSEDPRLVQGQDKWLEWFADILAEC